MIELKDIHKSYGKGEDAVKALNGISIRFDDKGLISIVGPSGCGKSTLLNIIGGLDRYDSGDILIDNESSKEYREADWDSYRNHRIGFIFQSYSLIPHLSVKDNVMMALSLSGVASKERKKRALEMLEKVGLKDKANKRPNQLSGGQMQRVAIARALINNPDILLCDEPTGALDSKTSVQIMDLIKEISKDKLVVMVTHNEEIAKNYSTRIIEMLDGEIVNDDAVIPCSEEVSSTREKKKKGTAMSFLTALKSSAKNLLTKKGRTIATSIAGSIGLIGIGLVLSLSSGITSAVGNMESTTLSGFPISIPKSIQTSFNYSSSHGQEFPKEDIYYVDDSSASSSFITHENKFDDAFLTYLSSLDKKTYNSISYSYDVGVHMAFKGDDKYGLVSAKGDSFLSSLGLGGSEALFEIPDSEEFILSQYDVLAGTYPSKGDGLAFVVDSYNKLSDKTLSSLGISLKDSYSSADLLSRTFRLLANDDYYKEEAGVFSPREDYEALFTSSSEASLNLKVSCILRIKPSAQSSFLSTGLGYPAKLTGYLLDNAKDSKVVLAQRNSQETNVLTGKPFDKYSSYEANMASLGGDNTPSSISIYPKSFEDKAKIKSYLDEYNKGKASADTIVYRDLAEQITGVLTSVIDIIAVVLSAIAAISLVVSSVMIAIIIYVSVIERTQEIGIMRALGARKKDITRIFSSEALSIGLVSGLIGAIVTYFLDLPIGMIVSTLLQDSFYCFLPPQFALILLALSLVLTFLAGIFPALFAAKKDPVAALRMN